MRRRLFVLILMSVLVAALPTTAVALGFDVEAKAGAGIGLGSTDNTSITGAPRLAADGGVGIDLYLFNLGGVDVGISTGAEYSYLTFHSVWSNFQGLGIDQTSDATYNYLDFPIALVCSIPLSSSMRLVARAGAFIGYFLSGSANLQYPANVFGLTSGTTTLDSSNTIQMEYGVHATAGADIDLGGGLSVSPAVQLDLGLTDTTVNVPGNSFKDTLWSLTAMVGIKYKVL
jgi:hypothetical protein